MPPASHQIRIRRSWRSIRRRFSRRPVAASKLLVFGQSRFLPDSPPELEVVNVGPVDQVSRLLARAHIDRRQVAVVDQLGDMIAIDAPPRRHAARSDKLRFYRGFLKFFEVPLEFLRCSGKTLMCISKPDWPEGEALGSDTSLVLISGKLGGLGDTPAF